MTVFYRRILAYDRRISSQPVFGPKVGLSRDRNAAPWEKADHFGHLAVAMAPGDRRMD